MKNMKRVMFNFFIFICFHSSRIKSQQQYSANEVFNCTNKSLYTCNGQRPSCMSFLIFKSKPPYDSVTTIAALMSFNPSELARINNISKTAVFPHEKDIIILVNCSCSHEHYEANTFFHLEPQSKTYFVVANETFQGLSSCGSLKHANRYNEFKLENGFKLKVPLRCACPTEKQIISNGAKYLLTYPISSGESVYLISRKFNVTAKTVLKANGISETTTLYPFTTLLIPLQSEPLIYETSIQHYVPTISVNSSEERSNTKRPLKIGITVVCSLLVFTFVLVTILGLIYRKRRKQKNEEMADSEMLPEDLLVKIASFERIIKVFSFKELQKDSCYLVFEHMNMGSLKEWIRRQRSEKMYNLRTRVQIGIDVACGLQYLHSFAKPGYVHNNINSSNILLDGKLRAKISNFSLARTVDDRNDDNALSLTTKIVGTRGYMALGNGAVTSKVDVYSFGVVMLELITGKDAVFRDGDNGVWVSTIGESEIRGMIDLENVSMKYAIQLVKLSMMCVKQDPGSRPSMDEVVTSLVRILVDLQTVVI